jgi:hypothetical protein
MTHTKDEALKLALEALTSGVDAQVGRVVWTEYDSCLLADAITAINEALAQPEQEPVGWITQARCFVPLHECTEAEAKLYGWKVLTTPPAAQRQLLTDEEIKAVIQSIDPDEKYLPKALRQFARAIEAKLKEKNNG